MMKSSKKKYIVLIAALCLAGALAYCFWPTAGSIGHATDDTEELEKIRPVGPDFNADSAYAYTLAQCNFGPRTMNSAAHAQCLQWIVEKFKAYGCNVTLQKADLKGYDGTILKAANIIARHNPQATTRLLICAHWDSRPWADNDPDSANWRKPILAANDGASGVAVMIELARLLQTAAKPATTATDSTTHAPKTDIGIDFVCFDAEDWGTPQWHSGGHDNDSWALGSNHFAQNLPEGFAPRYGVLLDMVGGQGARFYREGFSLEYAPAVVRKVWRAARQAGYASFFPNSDGGYITDDHVPLNQKGGIPCIDIVPYYPDYPDSSFGPTWHTLADDMTHIDRATLKAVGQTMIQLIYTEE